MAATTGGILFGGLGSVLRYNIGCNNHSNILLQIRNYAARKGTREKARKAKVKTVVEKIGFIPQTQRKEYLLKRATKLKPVIVDDSWKRAPIDNVWPGKYFQWKVYSFQEAIECHRETHHPTSYNEPNAFINALIELDLTGEKKNKLVGSFTRVVSIPHKFDHGEKRTVLAFCKTAELQKLATDAGATAVAGPEDIKEIQMGNMSLSDYDTVVAHPNILTEMLIIRGLMKKKFPNARNGNLDANIAGIVDKYINGIKYTATPHEHKKDYGVINVPFGTLTMDVQHLEENFKLLLQSVNGARPKREGPFITRVRLESAPSKELFKIDFSQYITDKVTKMDEHDDEDEDDDEPEQVVRSI
ncbi:uncharacterized protein LOC107273075 [Cephus cinctus]|uniref:Uncharacterized protein LOC107273075 n=1 Tax=Cephus cinctus TaxID=211228 RepID=A0AAJ7CBE3_CEPCN|nr:uncharacterized protein LOC107273075 [Cephus cinctus]